MIRIAITGNIGSGKTTICRIFESLGIRVYYADREAKKFYQRQSVQKAVTQLFGNDIFDQNNELIPANLAEKAFGKKELLKQLNAIIHPLVLDDFLKWAEDHKQDKYTLYESALLFESGFAEHFNTNILVTAPEELSMQRVITRDGLSKDEYISRRERQMSEKDQAANADIIIENDEKSPLIPRILTLHKQFELAGS